MEKNPKTAIVVRSDERFGWCPIGSGVNLAGTFEDRLNGYLEAGCWLLHVGQETSTGEGGEAWHTTGAVLGSDKARIARPSFGGPNIRIGSDLPPGDRDE